MAIVFLLNVSFPLSAESDLEAARQLASGAELRLRGEHVQMREPFVRTVSETAVGPPFVEFSAHPLGVGHGGPGELPLAMSEVTAADLSHLGEQLYNLLRQMSGYSAGYVGWDSEWLVDVADLERDWLADGSIYNLTGLVLADSIATKWRLDDRFKPFTTGYRWLPYTGTPKLF